MRSPPAFALHLVVLNPRTVANHEVDDGVGEISVRVVSGPITFNDRRRTVWFGNDYRPGKYCSRCFTFDGLTNELKLDRCFNLDAMRNLYEQAARKQGGVQKREAVLVLNRISLETLANQRLMRVITQSLIKSEGRHVQRQGIN